MTRDDLQAIESLWQRKQMGLASDIDLAQLNNYLLAYPVVAVLYGV